MISYCLVGSIFNPRVRILRKTRTYVLGRDPKADFPLPAESISRKHAELQWSESGGFAIHDLKSKNGTRVNDVPVMDAQPLRDGDRISIGPFMLQYREYRGDISGLLEDSDAAEATTALSREALQAELARGAAASAGFGGNFTGQELLEIIRLLAQGEKEGVLTIESRALKGQIGFEAGEIRRALAGSLRGEPAVTALLSLKSGRFEFVGGVLTGDKNCRIRGEGIAMEVARRLDESAATEEPGGTKGDGPAGRTGDQTMGETIVPMDPGDLA